MECFDIWFEYKCCALRDLVSSIQFKNVINTHGGVLFLVKLQASACNFAKSNTPPSVFFTFKIAQMVPNRAKCLILECVVAESTSVDLQTFTISLKS